MTIQQALDWINTKGEEFGRAGPRIVRGREDAASFARSRPVGSAERAEAGETVGRWSEMYGDWVRTLNRWNSVASRIPGLDGNLGLVPVVPIALAGTVIAIAVSMAILLRKLSAEERALKLLQQGRITPAEAIELAQNLEGGGTGLLGGLVGVPALLAAGAVAFFLMRRA